MGRSRSGAWLDSVDLPSDPRKLIDLMKDDDFSHSDLFRRAKRIHERKLRAAVEEVATAAERGDGYGEAARALFEAVIPAEIVRAVDRDRIGIRKVTAAAPRGNAAPSPARGGPGSGRDRPQDRRGPGPGRLRRSAPVPLPQQAADGRGHHTGPH